MYFYIIFQNKRVLHNILYYRAEKLSPKRFVLWDTQKILPC